jgi:multidrug efflux system membrane fusion protein
VYAAVKDSASKDTLAKIAIVTIDQTTGDSVGLSAGLNPNDVVVIDGQDKLQDGSKINPSFSSAGNSPGRSGAAPSAGQGAPKAGSPAKGQAGGSKK